MRIHRNFNEIPSDPIWADELLSQLFDFHFSWYIHVNFNHVFNLGWCIYDHVHVIFDSVLHIYTLSCIVWFWVLAHMHIHDYMFNCHASSYMCMWSVCCSISISAHYDHILTWTQVRISCTSMYMSYCYLIFSSSSYIHTDISRSFVQM